MSLDGKGPLWDQVCRALRVEIRDGRLNPGARLPSSRTLARSLGLSRNTTLPAYRQLHAEGYLTSKTGSGTFVATDLPATLKPNDKSRSTQRTRGDGPRSLSNWGTSVVAELRTSPLIAVRDRAPVRYDFLYGVPGPALFPVEVWSRAVARRARAASARTLGYGPPEGNLELRTELTSYLAKARGVECSPEQIVIVHGAQQALQLLCRVLVNRGDPVLIEDPHYISARHVLNVEGAELVPIPVDDDGACLDTVPPKVLRRAKLAYVTPSHQFPTGAVMSFPRRKELLSWADSAGATLVEDDYDSEFRYEGRPIESLHSLDKNGRVVYVGTFSKTLFPSLRVGYIVAPPSLIPALVGAKWLADWGNSTLGQQVLADLLRDGSFERHLRRTCVRYGDLRKTLCRAVEEHFGNRAIVAGANAGLHVLLRLDGLNATELDRLVQNARNVSVGVYSLAPYYLRKPKRVGLILGYTLLNERDIREGIRLLAQTTPCMVMRGRP